MATWDAAGPRAIDQDDGADERERHQDVGQRAVEVAPEVPDGGGGAARQAADERGEDGHADRGGYEVLNREPGHLAQVRHRRLAAVVLPVRVRHEARGRARGDVRQDGAHAVRIERQAALHAQENVEEHGPDAHENERRDGVGAPGLLACRPVADETHEAALDRGERMPGAEPVAVDLRHVDPERVREEDQRDRVEDDLPDSLAAQSVSPRKRAYRR
jgi:hypothetical protein